MTRTVAVVQARMGSSRLPNKMLLHLHGLPVVEWVNRRVGSAASLDEVVFAIPDTPLDDVLALYLETLGANVFRGSEDDLVERYCLAARAANADKVVRICADNPLICPSEIDRLIDFHSHCDCDYAYNHIPRGNTYPDGLGAEICAVTLLEHIHEHATDPSHREHVFNYLWANPGRFRLATFEPPAELRHPELRLDIDTMSDYMALLSRPYRVDMSAGEIVMTTLQTA